MIHWSTAFSLTQGLIKTWGGLVKDPAFVGRYGSLMAQTDYLNRATALGFAQTLQAPGLGPAAKVFGAFTFDKWTSGPLPNQYKVLPTACLGGNALPYAPFYYPSTFPIPSFTVPPY